VRFIEFMPFTGNRWRSDKVVTLQQILKIISDQYEFIPVQSEKHDTAKKFIVPGHLGSFAVISTMSAHFCGDCNRMRLTADGKLKNCLFSDSETDLLSPLRNGEDIRPLIHECISKKAQQLGGQFSTDFEHLQLDNIHNRSMITIGG
jgi:cyclic pyranopterin phosphate synthase